MADRSTRPSNATAGTSGTTSTAARRSGQRGFIGRWIRHTWLDLILLIVLGGLTLGLHYAPIPFTRVFPITFYESGDIVKPDWAYPVRHSAIPSWLAALLSILVPIFVFLIAQVRIRDAWDLSHAIFGVLWATALGAFVTVLLKLLVGGLRPDFLQVCNVSMGRLQTGGFFQNKLTASGFLEVMYTVEICQEANMMKLKNAMTSFPSGHAVAYFAGFGFLFLWLNAKLKIWSDHKPAFWKLLIILLPLLLATLLSLFLLAQNQNHWYDILAGIIIGLAAAFAVFRISYAAVWDWRYNHTPLDKSKPYDYGTYDRSRPVITRNAGWGSRKGKNLRDDEEGVGEL